MPFKRYFTDMSPLRKRYALRLLGRAIVLIFCIVMAVVRPESFAALHGMQFFDRFTWLHALWIIWVIDMLCQLLPIRADIALGSQKLWRMRFKPLRDKINLQAARQYIVSTTRSAYRVMLLWLALIALIGTLYFTGVITRLHLFLITAAFYVCDLVCVLIWCPFRLILHNKCCTTCRIFNWDHLMMFSPLLFFPSFYCWSLLLMAVAAWSVWEIHTALHPERFWEGANGALSCLNCTDKLCTQYCRKLRPHAIKEKRHE